ncbi:MAG: SIMPL domain-containing protein [Balneolaceae bacterium]
MKSLFTLLAIVCFTASPLFGQEVTRDKITLDATGEIRVPADLVNLQIQITVTRNNPKEAFREHKRQESILADLIQNLNLEEDLGPFQPITVGSRQMRDERQFTTSQSVHLTLTDFSRFEEIQLTLIENGFESFSGSFSSSKLEKAREEALELAISTAREQANQIAAALGRCIEKVHSVTHTSHQTYSRQGFQLAEMRSDSASMMDFEASIPVQSTVTVVFHLGS